MRGIQMATKSLNVISTSILAGLKPTAAAISSPFASPLSIVLFIVGAGVLAIGAVLAIVIVGAR
jgi:hypothetical protein